MLALVRDMVELFVLPLVHMRRSTKGAIHNLVHQLALSATTSLKGVRICSCIIPVTFTVYLCSVTVCSCLNWVAIVIVDCSHNALQPTRVHYDIDVYSGICMSICPIVVMYDELLWSSLA